MPRAPKKTEKTEKKTPTARAKPSRRATDQAAATVTEVEISRLAYQIFESRRGNGGSPLDDWLEAERLLRTPDAR
jgi:hypothetical protein